MSGTGVFDADTNSVFKPGIEPGNDELGTSRRFRAVCRPQAGMQPFNSGNFSSKRAAQRVSRPRPFSHLP